MNCRRFVSFAALLLVICSCGFKNKDKLEEFLKWAWPAGLYEEMLQASGLKRFNSEEYILELKPEARLRVQSKAEEYGFSIDWKEYTWFCRQYIPCAILSELADHPGATEEMHRMIKIRVNYYTLRLYFSILSYEYSPDNPFPEDGDLLD